MLEYSPKDSTVWVIRGEALAEQKRYDEAEEAFLFAVGLASTKRFALTELGYFYVNKTRDFGKAMDVCERLFEFQSDLNIAWRLKGDVLFECRRYQEAVIACEEAIAHGGLKVGNAMGLWDSYGASLLFSGRCGDALTALEHAATAAPGFTAPLTTRGVLLSRLQRHAEALEWYEAAILANPRAPIPKLNKAETLAYLERYDEAESILNDVLASEPESFGAWSVKGLLETRRGRYDDAMTAYSKSIQLEPLHADTYAGLALLLLALDDAQHACQVVERAVTLDPYDARWWHVKAQALRAAGRAEEANAAEQHGAALLAEQEAQVDAYLRTKKERGQ
jgi:superkiller protein 3